jgi:hypothetical protein
MLRMSRRASASESSPFASANPRNNGAWLAQKLKNRCGLIFTSVRVCLFLYRLKSPRKKANGCPFAFPILANRDRNAGEEYRRPGEGILNNNLERLAVR